MKPNKNICLLPWISLEVGATGKTKPCCLYDYEDPDIDLSNGVDSAADAFNSESMKELRRRFLNGEKPDGCYRCWMDESVGRKSKRLLTDHLFKNHIPLIDWSIDVPDRQLWMLDLKLGNTCNLKCRICGSFSSSKWAQEEIDRFPNEDKKTLRAYDNLQKGKWPEYNMDFWNNLRDLMPYVKRFEFTGGEPMLIKNHWDLVNEIAKTEYAKTVRIHYNTNGTVDVCRDIWKEFKNIEIAFSIDNVSERFEYERFGASWDVINTNIDKAVADPHISTQLCFTVNVQNVYYLDEILLWAKEKNFDYIFWNLLHYPWYMSIQNMTEEARKEVIHKIRTNDIPLLPEYADQFEQFIGLIEKGEPSDGKAFSDYMKITDKYRKQHFTDTHPEIAKLMRYE